MKKCSRCKQKKSLDKFTKDKSTKTGFAAYCKECGVQRVKDYYLRVGKHKQREVNLKKNYGITLRDYDTMFAKQGFRCAICGTKSPGGRHNVFHVDHCHKTGLVRGLLCNGCNRGLGFFSEQPQSLKRAAEYLEGFE